MKAMVETGLLVGGPAKGRIEPFTGDQLLHVAIKTMVRSAAYKRAIVRGEQADFGFWLWTEITIDEGMAELFGAAAAGWGSAGWGGKR